MQQIKSYEYMLAIAENGNISEAAERLGLAQSALSRYVLKLEREIGTELLDRRSLPIRLTKAGMYYVQAGRKILDISHQLEKQLEDVKMNRNRQIRIGTGPSRAPALIPLILQAFSKACPDVRVVTDECRTVELAERLADGKLDLIITFQEEDTVKFAMEALFKETVFLAVPPKYMKTVQQVADAGGTVDVSELDVPFVSLHEGQQLRNALDILSKDRICPQYESDYLGSAMALVAHGMGVTLVPSYWKLMEPASGMAYVPIRMPKDISMDKKRHLSSVVNRRIGIFYRKEQFLSEAEKIFICCAKDVCASINEL